MEINQTLFDMALDNVWEMYDSWDYSPKRLSQHFGNMVMEHMSVSGLANAHSMSKSFEYLVNKKLDKETRKLMFSGKDTKYDVALDVNTAFTVGGFGYLEIA